MPLPILFIHRGDEDYVRFCLQQAKMSNPLSDVILLGNAGNRKHANERIRHEMMQPYFQGAAEFAGIYRHVSPNAYEYNLFCLQRWYILRDFMRMSGISVCCYLDSDVMLYTDINDPKYRNFSFEFTWTSFVSLPELERFCTFLTSCFFEDRLFEQVESYTWQIGQPAVSDMVLFSLYAEKLTKYRTVYGIFEHDCFDHNLNVASQGIEAAEDGKKNVYLRNGSLFFRHAASGRFFRVNSLHFQGPPAKRYIPYFYSPHLPRDAEQTLLFDYATCQWLPFTR